MNTTNQAPAHPRYRHDGWTPERRELFLGLLAGGYDVRRACAGVRLSRQAAYKLRGREPGFAQAWDAALRSTRQAAEDAFLAMLPERLLRTMSELSGKCELRPAGNRRQDSVSVVRGV